MNRFIHIILLMLLMVVFAIPGTKAQDESENRLVGIEIVPERSTIAAGEEIWIGIRQTIAPGWHTYWKNPGDSGTAPRILWVLPKSFEISEVQWPSPQKIIYGPLVNYGYENTVTLLQKLKAPATLPEGAISFKASVEVLVCKDECIPETSTHELFLNGSESSGNIKDIKDALEDLPQPTEWQAEFTENNGSFVIDINTNGKRLKNFDVSTAEFFPEEWGLVVNAQKPEILSHKNHIVISQPREQRSLENIAEIKGLLAYGSGNARQVYSFSATKTARAIEAEERKTALISTVFIALLGGIFLNLMPCVFPVLSIKALSLVKISEHDPRKAQLHGLVYTAGVMLSFLAIAALLIALRAGGEEIGWGFQLQNPFVVTLIAYLLFVVGLNLSGLFEISGHFGNIGSRLTKGEDLRNSFFTGVLATLVAAPCTAPFMGVAIGIALLQPAAPALLIFAALGLGLALPYLFLAYVPELRALLPRPGPWMKTFRQLLAFPMFASSAWLVWVISQQAGPMGVFGALMGLVLISFALWLLSHIPRSRYWRYKARILALIAFAGAFLLMPAGQMGDSKIEKTSFGEVFSEERLDTLLEGDNPVFVEMTAAWCITCKVNHAMAINTEATQALFADMNVQYLIGDWTNQDAGITEYLKIFDRSGVPLYVFYEARDEKTGKRPDPKVLPQILTHGIIKDALENATPQE